MICNYRFTGVAQRDMMTRRALSLSTSHSTYFEGALLDSEYIVGVVVRKNLGGGSWKGEGWERSALA